MLDKILSLYGINDALIQTYGSGLINHTWRVHHSSQNYILQKINQAVFKDPALIAANIEAIGSYLEKNQPEYFFVSPLRTKNGESMVHIPEQGYFRLFPFVRNSHTVNVASSAQEAFEAARQFGLFTKVLSGLPVDNLNITLPGFHDLTLRHFQFEHACRHGNLYRIRRAQEEIDFLRQHSHVVATFQHLTAKNKLKLRITHHDTKISNVLFDREGKGLCVIDLDTVMPGYFISDVGDMMRTYLSPVSEEEKDLSRISIREEYFEAILQGYLQEMAGELNTDEVDHFVYSGMFLIYMQAMRFLTDYLNDDVYYGAAYEEHNYMRAKNQICLFAQLAKQEKALKKMVTEAAMK
jgi:Ser/Thr protein kinase RdoA (MazF antagonist)